MVHIVFDITSNDYDVALHDAKEYAKYITENSGNELYALTVTGGAQPEGYSMMPCMITSRQKHILL